jgi:hypothetical protein
LADEVILKSVQDEEASKAVDENALKKWEEQVNGGQKWEGPTWGVTIDRLPDMNMV